MNPPTTLPAQLYLLAFDPGTNRLRNGSRLGYSVRAATLVDLQLAGHLSDDAGKVRVQTEKKATDPVLAAVLNEIAEVPPRPWKYWIRANRPATVRGIADQMQAEGLIRVVRYRWLGLVPRHRTTLTHPQVRKPVADAVSAALSGKTTAASVEPHDAALVALAAAGGLKTVLGWRQRRRHRERVAQLIRASGPAPLALRKAVSESRSAG